MNVSNNLFGNIGSSLLSNVGSTAATTTTASPSSIPPPMGGAVGSASISTPGQFFSQMQQLSQSNPTEFKTVAAAVAKSFQTAASQATGSQAQFLTNLANQFTQAAQTGTMPSPQGAQSGGQAQGAQGSPSGSFGAHHHHHHGGGGSMSQSSSVQQAFQSAMSILEQATGGTSSSGSSTSTSA
jgi:hypothetical protein